MTDKAKDRTEIDVDLKTANGETVNELLRTASREVLLDHKRAGQSVVVWDRENDRILTIPPEQIPDEADADEAVESGRQGQEQEREQKQNQTRQQQRRASLLTDS